MSTDEEIRAQRDALLIKYGFTPWHGPRDYPGTPSDDVIPVPVGTLVDIAQRCGDLVGGLVAGEVQHDLSDSAEALFWYDDGLACDIVGYRLNAAIANADAEALGTELEALWLLEEGFDE